MPARLNHQGIDVPPNLDLSELDKAFITLNYPRKEPVDGGMSVLRALKIAEVPNDVSGEILDLVAQEQYQQAREKFTAYNMRVMTLMLGKSHPKYSSCPTQG